MLQWTGEQFLPTIKDALTVYLLVHRYVYASGFLKGKRVLDIAAGDGYGSSILAESAASVVGIVPDEAIARYASEKYKKPNIQFLTGSFPSDDQSFDAAVCLDASEIKPDHTSLLIEYKHLVKPGGLFILSSQINEAGEFRAFLASHFKHVQIFGQRIYANSSIWPVREDGSNLVSEIRMSRNSAGEFESVGSGHRVPSSLIAIASDSNIAERETGSVFIDEGNELLEDKEKAIRELNASKAYQAEALKSLEGQLADRRESLAHLQEAFAWHKSQILALTKTREYLESENSHLRSKIASSDEALAWRASQVEDLVKEQKKALAWYASVVENLEREVQTLRPLAHELEGILASRGWQFVLRLRAIRKKLTFWRG